MNYLILAGDHRRVPQFDYRNGNKNTVNVKRVRRILSVFPYERLGTLLNGDTDTVFVAGTGDYSGEVFENLTPEERDIVLRGFDRVDMVYGQFDLKIRIKENGRVLSSSVT